jgi:hypothetical protein
MVVRLAEHGKTLATRPLAAELRERLDCQKESTIELDFEGVLGVSYSFADEFLGRLGESALDVLGARIEVFNASDEVRPVLERAVELRDVGRSVRIAIPA